jgi:hypothetical protein
MLKQHRQLREEIVTPVVTTIPHLAPVITFLLHETRTSCSGLERKIRLNIGLRYTL